jgi:hypothetical protein
MFRWFFKRLYRENNATITLQELTNQRLEKIEKYYELQGLKSLDKDRNFSKPCCKFFREERTSD